MATLKGQNFRIGAVSSNSEGTHFTVFGMSTSCTVTRNTQTDDASTKDDVGLSSKPTVLSKSCQVQVESLNVTDAAAMLTAIKSLTPLTLMWDETSTTDNQTALQEDCSRMGQFYMNDGTFTFNDRENSAKSLQFISTGPISNTQSGDITTTVLSAGSYTKGQFVRLFMSSDNTATPTAVIAAARQLSLHVSVQMESATTKDTAGDWDVQEPVGISYDISTTALVRSGETITSQVTGKGLADLEDIYETGTPVKWLIANTSGANNRTKGSVICSGSALISQLQISAQNKQSATYTAQLQGYGAYTVGS